MGIGSGKVGAALSALKRIELQEAFDATVPGSRASTQQQEALDDLGRIRHRYIVSCNQGGKTQLGAREAAWVLTDTHPTWERPEEWGDEPLQLLIIGQTEKVNENVIWPKISKFLDPSEIKIQRTGASLSKVTHVPTGNHIIFFSHYDIQAARRRIQGFVSHWAWIDEMPTSMAFIKEVQMRVHAKRGAFLTTFTPLIKNDQIRKLVDGSQEPLSRKYQFSFLANPINVGREEEILAEYAHLPQSMIRTRLYGDWSTGEGSVYMFDPSLHVKETPKYCTEWRHYESVDPASGTRLGYLLFAQDPDTGCWHVKKSDYIENVYEPTAIVEEVKKRSVGTNMDPDGRIADGHETWFIHQAAAAGLYYSIPNKRNRKGELIANLQEALGKRLFIDPSCVELIEELVSCSWNADQTAIVKASTYHLLDAAQYFVDFMPKDVTPPKPRTWQEHLRQQNEEWKSKQQARRTRKAAPSPIDPGWGKYMRSTMRMNRRRRA